MSTRKRLAVLAFTFAWFLSMSYVAIGGFLLFILHVCASNDTTYDPVMFEFAHTLWYWSIKMSVVGFIVFMVRSYQTSVGSIAVEPDIVDDKVWEEVDKELLYNEGNGLSGSSF